MSQDLHWCVKHQTARPADGERVSPRPLPGPLSHPRVESCFASVAGRTPASRLGRRTGLPFDPVDPMWTNTHISMPPLTSKVAKASGTTRLVADGLTHPPPNRAGTPLTYTIGLLFTKLPSSGSRWWWMCPACDRRVDVLY